MLKIKELRNFRLTGDHLKALLKILLILFIFLVYFVIVSRVAGLRQVMVNLGVDFLSGNEEMQSNSLYITMFVITSLVPIVAVVIFEIIRVRYRKIQEDMEKVKKSSLRNAQNQERRRRNQESLRTINREIREAEEEGNELMKEYIASIQSANQKFRRDRSEKYMIWKKISGKLAEDKKVYYRVKNHMEHPGSFKLLINRLLNPILGQWHTIDSKNQIVQSGKN